MTEKVAAAPGICPYDMTGFQHRSDFGAIAHACTPATRSADGIVYIFDGDLAISVLKSTEFHTFDLHTACLEIESRTGLDFSASHLVFSKLAVVRQGSGHRPARIQLANRMSELHVPLMAKAEEIIESTIRERLVAGGCLDLCADLFFAIYAANAQIITGLTDINIWWAADLVSVTFPHTNLRKRLAINDDLKSKAKMIGGDEDEVALKLALIILGSEAFVGSIWDVISHQPDTPLNEIDWPNDLPSTAAPFVERQASTDWSNGQIDIRKGEKLRIVIGASVPNGPLNTRNTIFGRGQHSCIGRRYSEDLWRMFRQKISRLNLVPELVSMETRVPDTFLNFPNKALVNFHGR